MDGFVVPSLLTLISSFGLFRMGRAFRVVDSSPESGSWGGASPCSVTYACAVLVEIIDDEKEVYR